MSCPENVLDFIQTSQSLFIYLHPLLFNIYIHFLILLFYVCIEVYPFTTESIVLY